MTTKKLIQLRQLVKELKKEWKPCREYYFGCGGCSVDQLLKEFESFVEDYLDTEEEIRDYGEKWGKGQKT